MSLRLAGPAPLGAGVFSFASSRHRSYSLPLSGSDEITKLKSLTERKCAPCEGDVDPLTVEQVRELLPQLHNDWAYDGDAAGIERKFSFPAFSRTIAFVNAIAWVATNEGHHPDLKIGYGQCDVQYRTHSIKGLSVNDFICAARTDRIAEEL